MRWAIACALALGGAACGKVDTHTAEERVKELAEASTHVPVASVSCESADRKKGVAFPCSVTFKEGGTHPMIVTLTDDNADFVPAWQHQVVSKTYLGKQLGAHYGEPYDCGAGVIEAPTDIPCKGGDRAITVHIDENGDARW